MRRKEIRRVLDCIVLDDEEDVVMTVATKKQPVQKPQKKIEKRLINEIRKNPILYYNKHKFFADVAKKNLVWQQIADKLQMDVDVCKNTWIEQRYKYQNHARRLRKFFQLPKQKKQPRPAMDFERELSFLWRFVDNPKYCPIPYEIVDPPKEDTVEILLVEEIIPPPEVPPVVVPSANMDDDLILIEQPVELIVIDEDDETKNNDKIFHITDTMKVLISHIKQYPELYDSSAPHFMDYSRKSFIWNTIANQIGDKATKLMKSWIIMETRFEWEVSRNQPNADVARSQTELQKLMEFFEPYILANPNTVYKFSYYLSQAWYEPIDYFKDIYNLIARMKRIPDIVYLTDTLLKKPEKTEQFFNFWTELARHRNSPIGQLETTWLIMRNFYWQLMNMRKQNYQLTDKWYFEIVITELYDLVKDCRLARLARRSQESQSKDTQRNSTKSTYDKHAVITLPMVTLPTTAIQQQQQPSLAAKSLPQTPTMAQQAPLPIISSAVSLAPQPILPASTGSTLQIRPITIMPPPAMIQQTKPRNSAPLPKVNLEACLTMPPRAPQLANPILSLPVKASVANGNAFQRETPKGPATAVSIKTVTPITTVTARPIEPPIPISTAIAIAKATPTATPIAKTTPTAIATLKATATPTAIATPTATATTTTMAKPINQTPNKFTITQKRARLNLKSTVPPANTPTAIPNTNSVIESSEIKLPAGKKKQTNPVDMPPLPKISGAVSLLNHNEILIELIASQHGNHLVVHGPPLSEKYNLPMPTVANFIREILAIPLLHNKRHNQPPLINSYWDHIAKKFSLPPHICRACWNFLLENFAHFPQIASMKELMKPFVTTLKVWTESSDLFSVFDSHATANGWLVYMPSLPELVECIGTYPVLYKDLDNQVKDSSSDMEALCAWRTIALRFPNINDISNIWAAFKNIFCQYMSDIEFGIDNKWHINWWRVLARLKFLIEARYNTNEPYYYIVSNKMVEEIERCAMIEMKKRYCKEDPDTKDNATSIKKPIITDEMMLDGRRQSVEMVALLTSIEKYPIIFEKGDCMQKYDAWNSVAKELQMDVTDCLLAFRGACQKYSMYKRQDSVSRCPLNQKYYKRLDAIFRSVKPSARNKLNIRTPFELNQSVDDEQRAAVASITLPSSSSSAPHSSSTTSATALCGPNPLEDLVFPERYISDICMSHCESDLVVKNWIFALGNLPISCNENIHFKLRNILKKYQPSTGKKLPSTDKKLPTRPQTDNP